MGGPDEAIVGLGELTVVVSEGGRHGSRLAWRSLHDPGVQPLPNQSQDNSISYPALHEFTQMLVIQRVEELPEVDFHHPAASLCDQPVPQRVDRLMGVATGSETERSLVKQAFVNRLQKHHHGPLQHLVLERRYPDGPGLRTRILGDVRPTHRRGEVTSGAA